MRDPTSDVMAKDERARDGDPRTFDRSFKYAVVIYAVVEFCAIALALCYKLAR